MMRLRTTATWSALALVMGIGGTAMLSALSGGGEAHVTALVAAPPARGGPVGLPRPAVVARTLAHKERVRTAARPATSAGAQVDRVLPPPLVVGALDVVAAPQPVSRPHFLVPVSMPADNALPWAKLRGHLDGQVLLRVEVDAAGQVRTARIARSSGDGVLDAEALRSARQWRFAVPPDAPDGIAGEVPVRYVSAR